MQNFNEDNKRNINIKTLIAKVDEAVKDDYDTSYPSLIDVLVKTKKVRKNDNVVDEFVVKTGNSILKNNSLDEKEKVVINEFLGQIKEDEELEDLIEFTGDGYIEKIDPELLKIQSERYNELNKVNDTIINHKKSLFEEFGLNCSSNLYEALIDLNEEKVESCFLDSKDTAIDNLMYKKLYKNSLCKFLDIVKEKNPNVFFNDEDKTKLKNLIEKFENYVSSLFDYRFGKKANENTPKFGGLSIKDIKKEFIHRFGPKYSIKMSDELIKVHENNHIKDYDKNREERFNTAKNCFYNILNQYDKVPNNELKEAYQINALLNLRESYLMMSKAYLSYGVFRGIIKAFNNDCNQYKTEALHAFDQIVEKLGVSKKFATKFLDNKVKNIKVNGKTIDYNKVYKDNLDIFNNISGLNSLGFENGIKIEVDDLNKINERVEVNQELAKEIVKDRENNKL